MLQIFLLFKRISASDKTDYSEKLLDLAELILSTLNLPVQEQSLPQLKLTLVCLSIITDMLEVN